MSSWHALAHAHTPSHPSTYTYTYTNTAYPPALSNALIGHSTNLVTQFWCNLLHCTRRLAAHLEIYWIWFDLIFISIFMTHWLLSAPLTTSNKNAERDPSEIYNKKQLNLRNCSWIPKISEFQLKAFSAKTIQHLILIACSAFVFVCSTTTPITCCY